MTKLARYFLPLLTLLIAPVAGVMAQQRIEGFTGLEWYKMLGKYGSSMVGDLEHGADGSIYYAGTYNDHLRIGTLSDFDTTYDDPITIHYDHAYVVKLDDAGNFKWIWVITGTENSQSRITDIQLSPSGDLWVTGMFAGEVRFPSGRLVEANPPPHVTHLNDAFVIKISANGEESNFIHVEGEQSSISQKIMLRPDGAIALAIHSPDTAWIGNDTLFSVPGNEKLITILLLDADGNVLVQKYFRKSPFGNAGYVQSTMAADGNIYLQLWAGSDVSGSETVFYGLDTFDLRGSYLLKLTTSLEIEWIKLCQTESIGESSLDATVEGEIYRAAVRRDANSPDQGFVEKYDSDGNHQWTLKSDGYTVISKGIAVEEDFLYWSGYYQCEMAIDTVRFIIGERQPSPSPAHTGFICLINKHTGKLAWAMSDATTDEDKRFGKIVAFTDDQLVVATDVRHILCSMDTLDIQVGWGDIPYGMLVSMTPPTFPIWPEPLDSLHEVYLGFTLWPNPARGEIFVRVDEHWEEESTVEIFNAEGRLLQKGFLEGLETKVILNEFCHGLMYIRVSDTKNHQMFTNRLVNYRQEP